MNLSSLHTSISDMNKDKLRKHIKYLRSLRRMLLESKIKVVKDKSKKKNKKLVTRESVNNHVANMTQEAKAQLLKNLLKIKERKDGKSTNISKSKAS